MAKTEDGHTIVEGDASAVPVRVAPGDASETPRRPTKGVQLVWGGNGPSSPWGHLQALIEGGGGSVQYTYLHSTVLADLAKGKKPKPPVQPQQPTPEQQKQDDDAERQQHEDNTSFIVDAAPDESMLGEGHEFEYDNKGKKDARLWAHPAAPQAKKVPLLVFLHGIAPKLDGMDCDYPQLQLDFSAHPFGCHLGRLAKGLID